MLFQLIISIPLFVSAFWLTYFVVYGLHELCEPLTKPYRPSLTAISLFYLATTALYACHLLYFADYRNVIAETIYATCNLSVYPLFYLYLIRLCKNERSRWVNNMTIILLYIPALVVMIGYVVCFAGGYENVRHGFYLFARVCFALQVLFVWIVGSRMIRRYKDALDDFYSDNRSYKLRPLHILLQLFGTIAIASALMNLIGREWFVGKMIITLPSLLMSILLYALGYVAAELARTVKFEEKEPIDNTDLPPKHSSLSERLEQLMTTEQPYLQPNLTVQDLATMLGTNRTYLSQMFRDELGVSFSTYINTLRIEHAKHILADPHFSTSKEAILNAQCGSGFASESTFYHLFKQHTGMTPLAYRQQRLSAK